MSWARESAGSGHSLFKFIKMNLLGLSFPIWNRIEQLPSSPPSTLRGHCGADWRPSGVRAGAQPPGAAWLGSYGGAEAMFSWRMTVHARLPTWWHTRAHPSPGNPNHQCNVCYSPSVHLGKKRVEISKVWLKKIRRERDWISSLTQQTLGEMQKAKRMCCIRIPFSKDDDSCEDGEFINWKIS